MRAPPSWLLPAIVAVAIGVAVLVQLGGSGPAPAARPSKSDPPSKTGPLPKFEGAPTNQLPPKSTPKTDEGPPTPDQMIERWRGAILRKNIQAWQAIQSSIRRDWATYRDRVIKLADSDENERVRAVNLNLLTMQKESGLVDFFAERLRKDSSPFVRENCCRALGDFGAKQYASLVREYVNDGTPAVAAVAKAALKQMGETP